MKPRAWLDYTGRHLYLRSGRKWYEYDVGYGPWQDAEPAHASLAWMREYAYELQPREAAKLEGTYLQSYPKRPSLMAR